MTNSYFHIVEDNIVILSNLPKELLPEFDTCEAETKCLICPIKKTTKRQKRIKSSSGGKGARVRPSTAGGSRPAIFFSI